MKEGVLSHRFFPASCHKVTKELEIELSDFTEIQSDKDSDYQRIYNYVRFLLHKHPNRLKSVLYRIDIPEKALELAINAVPPNKEIDAICSLLISREIKKMETREQYSSKKSDIPDDLKW